MKKALLMALILMLLLSYLPAWGEQPAPKAISTPEQLQAIGEDPQARYVLVNHIDMQGFDWTPIPFGGDLDGQGYSIYNLCVSRMGPDSAITIDGNHKEYDTRFAALFSVVRGATIRNLDIKNVQVDVQADVDCFAAGLAGFAEDTMISNCSVSGRVRLAQSAVMTGVAGLVGFGYVTIADSAADVELVFVDTNTKVKCEEFLGAILACGYGDIENCVVKLQGYASVYGYVHNGGIVGMYHVHRAEDEKRKGFIRGCSVDAYITFFEKNNDRRAYCKAYAGEKLNKLVKISGNKTIRFKSKEVKKYKNPLLPEKDAQPRYQAVTFAPTQTEWGYTLYTCLDCDYSYTEDYRPPLGAAQGL